MSDEMMLDYEEVTLRLQQAEANLSAAEVHGLLCGFIAAGQAMDGKSWMDFIFYQQRLVKKFIPDVRELLLHLYKTSAKTMQNMDFAFQLLLPGDEHPLDDCAKALSYWCQGFVIALERADVTTGMALSGECHEAFQHMVEISDLDYLKVHATEEDLLAYEEVKEYVRMAVLMIFTEINQDNLMDEGLFRPGQLH